MQNVLMLSYEGAMTSLLALAEALQCPLLTTRDSRLTRSSRHAT